MFYNSRGPIFLAGMSLVSPALSLNASLIPFPCPICYSVFCFLLNLTLCCLSPSRFSVRRGQRVSVSLVVCVPKVTIPVLHHEDILMATDHNWINCSRLTCKELTDRKYGSSSSVISVASVALTHKRVNWLSNGLLKKSIQQENL